MFVVDTNILIAAAHRSATHHAVAVELLADWTRERTTIALTWGIAYEFLRVATHPAVFSKPLPFSDAWSFLDVLRRRMRVEFLVEGSEHAVLVANVTKELPTLAGSPLHDLHTAILAREHGIDEVWSEDVSFHRFPWIRAVQPFTHPTR